MRRIWLGLLSSRIEAARASRYTKMMVEVRSIDGKLYSEIADAIAARILNGALRPGDRLPSERDLSHEFRVSRPTIREAMIALEVRGLVRTAERSGVFVTEPVHWAPAQERPALRRTIAAISTAEVLEAMATLLPQVAALAARSIASGEATARLFRRDSADQFDIFNQAAQVAGNVAIANIVSALIDAAHGTGLASVSADTAKLPSRLHLAVAEALEQGDAEEAARRTRAMIAHLFALSIEADLAPPAAEPVAISEQRRKLASRHPLAFAQ